MKRVTKQNPLPLYYQLKVIIQELIENEILKPGDAVPSERELCETHEISRMTARKAIMDLVNEGALYREQGKGTFVAQPKINQQINQLKSFTQVMNEKGFSTSTKILSFQIKEATKKNKAVLEMGEDQNKVFEIIRIRMVEEVPIALETVWISLNMCPDMKREDIEGGSLYRLLMDQYAYRLDYAKQTIEPIIINEYESDLLKVDRNSLALLFRRTTYLDNGKPIEYTKAIYRSDKYKYEVLLK